MRTLIAAALLLLPVLAAAQTTIPAPVISPGGRVILSASGAFIPPAPQVCPPGTTGTPPDCVPILCPEGTTGTPPNCIPIPTPDVHAARMPAIGDLTLTVGMAHSETLPTCSVVNPEMGVSYTFTYSLAGTRPVGFSTYSATTRVLSGTPSRVETQTLTHICTSSSGSTTIEARRPFTVTVQAGEDPLPPFPTPILAQRATVDEPYSFTLPQWVAGATYALTCVGGLPPGIDFDGTTRVLSGTPTGVSSVRLCTYRGVFRGVSGATPFFFRVIDARGVDPPCMPRGLLGGESGATNAEIVTWDWDHPSFEPPCGPVSHYILESRVETEWVITVNLGAFGEYFFGIGVGPLRTVTANVPYPNRIFTHTVTSGPTPGSGQFANARLRMRRAHGTVTPFGPGGQGPSATYTREGISLRNIFVRLSDEGGRFISSDGSRWVLLRFFLDRNRFERLPLERLPGAGFEYCRPGTDPCGPMAASATDGWDGIRLGDRCGTESAQGGTTRTNCPDDIPAISDLSTVWIRHVAGRSVYRYAVYIPQPNNELARITEFSNTVEITYP